MQKPLYITIAPVANAVLIAFIPQIASSRPLSKTSGYPVAPTSSKDNLVCYMETQEGAILNLEALCGSNLEDSRYVESSAGTGRYYYGNSYRGYTGTGPTYVRGYRPSR